MYLIQYEEQSRARAQQLMREAQGQAHRRGSLQIALQARIRRSQSHPG